MNVSEVLLDFVHTMPMNVIAAYPYFGTFVCFELTDVNDQPVRIRILMSDWLFKEKTEILASSSSNMEGCKSSIALLEGSKLLTLVQRDTESLELIFEKDKSFVLNANLEEYEDEDELLTIFVPEKYGIDYSTKYGFRKELVG